MNTLLSILRRRKGSRCIVECRHCGTSVDDTPDSCPTCGETGFAEYVLPC